MIGLLITLAIGAAGGFIGLRLKVPAGAVIGSMIAVGAFNVFTGNAFFPDNFKVIIQMIAGGFIGSRITAKDVKDIKHMIIPAVFLTVSMLGITTIIALLMSKLTILDLITSFFASAPGGIVDMSIIGLAMGADVSKVATLQLFRVIFVIGVFPPLLKFLCNKFKNEEACILADGMNTDNNGMNEISESGNVRRKLDNKINMVLTIAVAMAGGFIGYKLGIPAGTVIFAMISVALLGIFTGRNYMPVPLRITIQIVAGALIGSGMSYADIISLKGILLPVIMLVIGLMIMNILIGIVLYKICKLDLPTALFAAAPGGVTDMAIIAQELGANAPKVAVLQLVRLISVIAIFPIIIKYVSGIL